MKLGKKKKKKKKKKISLLRRPEEMYSSGLYKIDVNKKIFSSKCPKFPDFGKEVRREYEVSSLCYDCKRFVKGCKGWKAARKFECLKRKPYKPVMPG